MPYWSAVITITDCATGAPIAGASVNSPLGHQVSDPEGKIGFEVFSDDVDWFTIDISRQGYVVVQGAVVSQGGRNVICLTPAPISSSIAPPHDLRVDDWTESNVILRWMNPRTYDAVQVRWSKGGTPETQHYLPGSPVDAVIQGAPSPGQRFHVKVQGGVKHGFILDDWSWSPWSEIDWTVPAGPPQYQINWRWCARCKKLAFIGSGVGPCEYRVHVSPGAHPPPSAGGPVLISPHISSDVPHDHGPSGRYRLRTNPGPGYQDGWRYCSRCRAVVHMSGDGGICYDNHVSAGYRHHLLGASGPYFVRMNSSGPNEQDGWQFCGRCHGLVHLSGEGLGFCNNDEPHDVAGSGRYSVEFED